MAGRKKTFTLNILNQEGIILYGNYEVVFVPSAKGEMAIMAFHTPMIMMLTPGKIRTREHHKNVVVAEVEAGIVYVGENEVTILVNK